MSGDLSRMQSDDSAIQSAVQSVNTSGLNVYETTVARASAAISARQTVLTPLAGICIDELEQAVDCDELVHELRTFYDEHGQDGIERIHAEHVDVREGIERAIEHEDAEKRRTQYRESKQRARAAQRAQRGVMVAANG